MVPSAGYWFSIQMVFYFLFILSSWKYLFHIWWLMMEGIFRRNSKVNFVPLISKMCWKSKEMKFFCCISVDCWYLRRGVSSRLRWLLANLPLCFICVLHFVKWMPVSWFLPNVFSIIAKNILTLKCYALHLSTLDAFWNTAKSNIRPTKHSQFLNLSIQHNQFPAFVQVSVISSWRWSNQVYSLLLLRLSSSSSSFFFFFFYFFFFYFFFYFSFYFFATTLIQSWSSRQYPSI